MRVYCYGMSNHSNLKEKFIGISAILFGLVMLLGTSAVAFSATRSIVIHGSNISKTALTTTTSQEVEPESGSGEVAVWTSPTVVGSKNDKVHTAVGRQLLIDSTGVLYSFVILEQASGDAIVMERSTDDGATWFSPVPITDIGHPYGVNVAIDQRGRLVVAWVAYVDGRGHVYVSNSSDAGQTWSDRMDASGDLGVGSQIPSIAVDTQGGIHVVWHTGDNDPSSSSTPAHVYYTRSLDKGETFEEPRRLDSSTSHAAWPRMSIQSAGTVAVAWRDNRRNPDWDIYAAVSTDGGETFTETVVAASTAMEWDPEAFVDPNRVIHVAYTLPTANRGGQYVYEVSSLDGGVTWSEPKKISQESGYFSMWGYDPSSGAFWMLWKDMRNHKGGPTSGIGATNLAIAYSVDGGQTWSNEEIITSAPYENARFPSLAISPNGIPHVIWTQIDEQAQTSIVYHSSRQPAP